MNTIEELIQKECPEGVEYKKLEDIAKAYTGTQFNKSDMNSYGSYPVINGGISASGFIEKYNEEADSITISQGGASAGFVNWISTKFWLGAHCYIVKPNDKIINKYLYYLLKSLEPRIMSSKHGAGIPGLNRKVLYELEIPVPPLSVQHKIVEILDKFTSLEAELQAELEASKKQYEYYRNQLLDFTGREDVHQKSVGDVAIVTKLAGFEFTSYVEYSNEGNIIALRGLNVKKGSLDLKDVKYIDKSDFSKLNRSKLHIGDMLFTYVGTVGNVALINENDKFYLAPNVALIRIKNQKEILPEFLMQTFLTSTFKSREINRLLQNSSMKNIPMEKIRKFMIQIPSLTEQQRIVTILDKFEALINDQTASLAAEMKARHRQYEYYRDRLLTFQRKEA